MKERRTLRTRGEIIEEYRRDFPAERVEVYTRSLPAAMYAPTAPTVPAPRRKRRWKGVLILLAAALGLTAVVIGVLWGVQLFRPVGSDLWEEEEYYSSYEEDEDAPITIPTIQADPTARMSLSETRGSPLSAQAVYERVHTAVVTVMVDLGDDRASMGTGVLFREDGYLLTNHHVVSGGQSCTILLSDGTPLEAKFIASDAASDLAILKAETKDPLPTAEFGDSEALEVGEAVYAIGTPLNMEMSGTFTNGIVSSLAREYAMTETASMPLIQTNAALNNGNSGGPLINSSGQVVGINFMKMYARYSTVEGLGFAIPSAEAERVVNDLLLYGKTQPEPLLGIMVMQLPTQLADQRWGLEVASVTPGGAADLAGVRVGDYVLSADGNETLNSTAVLKARRKHHIGDEMTLTLWRDGEILTVTLLLTEAAE